MHAEFEEGLSVGAGEAGVCDRRCGTSGNHQDRCSRRCMERIFVSLSKETPTMPLFCPEDGGS
jgi:hypothetical protein